MNQRPILPRLSQATATFAAVGAAVVSLAVLGSWWPGPPRPLAFGPDGVPMAPSAALLMLMVSVAAWLRIKESTARAARVIEIAGVLVVMLGGCLLALRCLDQFTPPPIEIVLAQTADSVGSIPLGRISPLTALCFIAISAALLCSRRTEPRWRPLRSVAAWLSAAVLVVGVATAATCLGGTPFIYGGSTVPMASLTGISLALVSLAILLVNGWDIGPLRIFLRVPEGSTAASPSQIEWSLLLMMGGLTSGILIIGLRYLHQQQSSARSIASTELSAITQLKVQQLVHWRTERLSDGLYLTQSPTVARDVARLLENRSDPDLEAEISRWLTLLKAGPCYERITIFDSQGSVRLSLPSRPISASWRPPAHLNVAIRTNRVFLSDLHKPQPDGAVRLCLLVPILPPGHSADTAMLNGDAIRPLAVIELEINPDRFLFPLIRSWPTPNRTARTLLVRREEHAILDPKEARHRPNGGASPSAARNAPHWIANLVARGTNDVRPKFDEQGLTVVTVRLDVPETPWAIIASIGEAELYAPMRLQARTAALTTSTLIVTTLLGLTVIARRRSEQLLHLRFQAESEGRAVSERYEHFMRFANDAVLLIDANSHILEVNDRGLQSYGWTLHELQRMTFGDLIEPGIHSASLDGCRSIAKHEPTLFESVHRRKDGSTFPVEISANHFEMKGSPFVLAIVRDSTQRKQAETALTQSEALFHSLVENLPQHVFRKDLAGRFTFGNSPFCKGLGKPLADIIGKTDFDFFPTDLAARYRGDDQRVIDTGLPFEGEEAFRQADGQLISVYVLKTPVRDVAGQIVGIQGISWDVTRRRQTADQLRKLSRAVEQSPVLVLITNPSGEIEYVNPKFIEITGYSLDDVRGKTPRILKGGETPPEHYRDLWQRISRGEVWQGELHNRRKNGEMYWEYTSISPILDDRGQITHYLGIAEDITKHKQLESELALSKAQLLQQQRLESVGTLAGGVAHEINNPINGIMNYAQIIQDRLEAHHPLAEYTHEIIRESHRVATIVRNLLTFSRTDRQSHSPARIRDIVDATLSLIRTVIRHDQISLRVDVPTDLPELRCRSQQIQQVLMNLMTNSRDALNERYPGHDPDKLMILRANLIEREGRHWIRLTVEDHGSGIPPRIRDRMFDPFFTTKPRNQGTGLGLSISHGIVKEHRGTLTVESEPGRFTRLHLDLPLDPLPEPGR